MGEDPPDDGLLTLNLMVKGGAAGPLQGAEQIGFTVQSVDVVVKRRVNGALQAPQTITVATGPVPLWLSVPEAEELRFGGKYWIPPGEIQSVKVSVSDIQVDFGTAVSDVYINGPIPSSSGVLSFNPSGPKPEMPPYGKMGYLARIDAGASGAISTYGAGDFTIAASLPGVPMLKPRGFEFAEDQLLVRWDSASTTTQINNFLSNTGGQEVWSSWSGLRLIHFAGSDWYEISSKLLAFRNSPLVEFATLNPLLRVGGTHDPDLLNDPGFQSDNSAWMEDIGVESAWSTQLGSRDVVIAFIDTGIDINHPQLVNNLWVNEKELPDVCGTPFVETFDLDGDGYFTLNDLNNPTNSGELADALDDLWTCEGIDLNPNAFSSGSSGVDGGLFQGDDLIAAFADGIDSTGPNGDANSVVDDLFGANVAFSTPDSSASVACSMGVTSDVDPSGDAVINAHGTQMAGLVAAARDDGFNTAGIMDKVRIIEVRGEDACSGMSATDLEEALDYLDEFEPDIVVIEFGNNIEDTETKGTATIAETTTLFEMRPETLFITLAHNFGNDCNELSMVCWPAENDAANAIALMSTGTVATDPQRKATGRWVDPHPTSDEDASSFGDEVVDLAAPGYAFHNEAGAVVEPMMYSLAHGEQYADYFGWSANHVDATSATSAAIAITSGVAGLALAQCTAVDGDGEALAALLLDGADTTRGVFAAGEVASDRYLSATGALAAACSP